MTSLAECFNPAKLGGTLKAAYEKWKEVFGNLPQDKLLVFEQMSAFFTNCNNAYLAFFSKCEMDDKERIFSVGGSAYLATLHFNNIKRLLQKNEDKDVCAAIDATSRWLQDKGWFGLPAPYDGNGNKVYKTAWGCISDMRQFNDAMNKFVAMCHETNDRK